MDLNNNFNNILLKYNSINSKDNKKKFILNDEILIKLNEIDDLLDHYIYNTDNENYDDEFEKKKK